MLAVDVEVSIEGVAGPAVENVVRNVVPHLAQAAGQCWSRGAEGGTGSGTERRARRRCT